MPLPDVFLTINDGALRIVPEAIDGISAKIGICSGGTPNTFYSFSDIQNLKATLGVGPLVEAAAHLLAVSGGPVYCVPAASATPGSCGAIVHVGSGPAMTAAGAAYDTFQAIVRVVAAGALGSGTFQYSMDGGDTYSSVIVIPSGGTYLIPDSNITLTFPAGTYVANDTYSFSTTAPMYDSSTLNTAMIVLFADPREWRFLHVVGQAASVAGAAGIGATIDTALQTATANYRYVRAFMECPDDFDSNVITAFSSFASARVAVVVGSCELKSSLTGRTYKRSAAWPVAARAAKVPVHEDLGCVKSDPLPGVGTLYRDERVNPGLDSQRFTTLRTFVGLDGAYITSGRTRANVGSDYQMIQNGFVIDKACRIIRTALLNYLNDSIRVDATTGHILEIDARNIEADIESQLFSSLVSPGNASAVSAKVNRANNILSTMTLATTERITPRGYARSITADVGLDNPALAPS
jgi:hypothetical protein